MSGEDDPPPAVAPGALPPAVADALHRRLLAGRRPGAPLLLAFDVDGTLAPIVARPEDAAVPAPTRRALARLAAQPATSVAVVSGRAAADARRVVGLDGLWVIGNHGAETVAPDGSTTVDPLVAAYEGALAAARRALAADVARVAGATLEDKRWSLTIHYRRVADASGVAALERAAGRVEAAFGLALHRGKKVFELRPPVRVNKGSALLRLARDLGATAPGAALLFAGDDITDEDAFRALRASQPHAVTIKVLGEDDHRPVATEAEFAVATPSALRDAIDRLVTWLAPAV